MADPDADIRVSAFHHLRAAMRTHGTPLPWSIISKGFRARGKHFLLASAAEGIFRPAGMSGVLSVKTVVPKRSGKVWYHDQIAPQFDWHGDTLSYAFTGTDPERSRNQWLKEALREQLPLIYFFGVAPGLYEPLFPAFVTEWSAERLSCGLSFSSVAIGQGAGPLVPAERRYALRTVQQRLHQALFRESSRRTVNAVRSRGFPRDALSMQRTSSRTAMHLASRTSATGSACRRFTTLLTTPA